MKMHDGGLMAFLNPKTQEKAQTGNVAPEKNDIMWIDARELVRNEKNFYGIRDIEELAALIAASGVIEPLTVTPTEDGKYRIVAGERRTAATILRLERGDIIDPKVPCIVKSFDSSGALSAEDKEMLCLIASNRGQRQTRTALEKLQEIEELEPIAKKIFKDEQIQGTFRKFFAEQVLSISPAKLQRLKSLSKLVDEGRAALEIGMLSESAAVELATHTEEDQYDYLKALVEDNVQSRAEDVKIFFKADIQADATNNNEGEGVDSSSNQTEACSKDNNDDDMQEEPYSDIETEDENNDDVRHWSEMLDGIPKKYKTTIEISYIEVFHTQKYGAGVDYTCKLPNRHHSHGDPWLSPDDAIYGTKEEARDAALLRLIDDADFKAALIAGGYMPQGQQDDAKRTDSAPLPEKKLKFKNPSPSLLLSGTSINIDVPIPADMNMDQMEHEADTWMETILSNSIKIAEAKMEEARAEGETKIAALWDSRRAKAALVLETVRE